MCMFYLILLLCCEVKFLLLLSVYGLLYKTKYIRCNRKNIFSPYVIKIPELFE